MPPEDTLHDAEFAFFAIHHMPVSQLQDLFRLYKQTHLEMISRGIIPVGNTPLSPISDQEVKDLSTYLKTIELFNGQR